MVAFFIWAKRSGQISILASVYNQQNKNSFAHLSQSIESGGGGHEKLFTFSH